MATWSVLSREGGCFPPPPRGRGIKKTGFRMYRSRNESLILAAQDCCSQIADHDLCMESARQSNCGLLGLLCLSFFWQVCSLVSLGLAVTAVFLIDQVSVVNLFCFCVSLCCTTVVLYRYFSRQLSYMLNEVFIALTQWCSEEKYNPGVIASALRNGKMRHSTEECRRGMIRDRALSWHWRPHGYEQFYSCQIRKCRSGQNWLQG